MEAISIIVDTREQVPYAFGSRQVVRQALPAGDYSVEGFESLIAVERKTLEDFVHSVIRDRERFKKELLKLADYLHPCIVVEASLPDVLLSRYPSGAHPNSVFGATVSICVDYCVPVFFCGDRQAARRFTEEFLVRAVMQQLSQRAIDMNQKSNSSQAKPRTNEEWAAFLENEAAQMEQHDDSNPDLVMAMRIGADAIMERGPFGGAD
mgnify:CR=1 FL=1